MDIRELDRLTLANLGYGALEEMFQNALSKVNENVQDPNFDAKAKRTIEIKIHVVPTERRNAAQLLLDVGVKLPNVRPFETQVYLGIEGGELVVSEFNPQQMLLFDEEEISKVSPFKRKDDQ